MKVWLFLCVIVSGLARVFRNTVSLCRYTGIRLSDFPCKLNLDLCPNISFSVGDRLSGHLPLRDMWTSTNESVHRGKMACSYRITVV